MDLTEIVTRAGRLQEDLGQIRKKVTGAVMFIDLVGSTEFKSENPQEEDWLPRLATFLLSASRIVQTHGRVVKYIGDEVMAFFEGANAVVDAEHTAEQILEFCTKFSGYSFQVKIAIDFGSVSMLDFVPALEASASLGNGDPNGLVVDRCARIMSRGRASAVLCSKSFRDASQAKTLWRKIGTFTAKGIAGRVTVYQLKYGNYPEVTVSDPPMSLDECLRHSEALERQLTEMKALRKPIPSRRRN